TFPPTSGLCWHARSRCAGQRGWTRPRTLDRMSATIETRTSTRPPGASLFAELEPLLEQVGKPIQYVGGELNSQSKDWHCGGHGPAGEELTARWALMYPDAYEVGLPNQGVMILYEVLNERPDTLAE